MYTNYTPVLFVATQRRITASINYADDIASRIDDGNAQPIPIYVYKYIYICSHVWLESGD